MSVGVNIPQKKGDNGAGLSKLLTVGGAVAGGILGGGLPGAMAGAQAGGMLGGMFSKPEEAGPEPVQTSAIDRRLGQLDQSPLRQIREGIDSLKYIQDDQMRAELAKPLMQADYLARNKQGQV